MGTVYTMAHSFYPDALAHAGVDLVLPTAGEQADINRIIYDELVLDRLSDAGRARLVAIGRGLAARGAEGLILACTELPLAVTSDRVPIPVYDTSELHVHAALDRICD